MAVIATLTYREGVEHLLRAEGRGAVEADVTGGGQDGWTGARQGGGLRHAPGVHIRSQQHLGSTECEHGPVTYSVPVQGMNHPLQDCKD
eukprot:5824778-Pyramimonas_sp.AAC.1